MKIKIVLALSFVFACCFTYLDAKAVPANLESHGEVTVDVIRKLSIKNLCDINSCVVLPNIYIGESRDITTGNVVDFEISGEPNYHILLSVGGSTGGTISGSNATYKYFDFMTMTYKDDVTMTGRWGSYDDGTTAFLLNNSATWGSDFPEVLSGLTPTSGGFGLAYCSFIVDNLTASSTSAPGQKTFIINVEVIYNEM